MINSHIQKCRFFLNVPFVWVLKKTCIGIYRRSIVSVLYCKYKQGYQIDVIECRN